MLLLATPDARADDRRDHERARAALAAGEIRPAAIFFCSGGRPLRAGLVLRFAGRLDVDQGPLRARSDPIAWRFQMATSMYWDRRLRVPDLNLCRGHEVPHRMLSPR
ncbi:hypothetical protein [Neoroseomonas oryzicola]|uniref:Uncharacterized protein n=1 Tax=Neoroseomonas oryzicola TaxID=535904 RepID=A0A9X9WJX9_9PROT|nr:hypothetical protein [Neoroseomonas oryzicola]MBR0660639.1 hypothetical protein [Neoroseomonas oryzicola]NKE20002.1 hypothetical protein [Neoroseomonas oryzicola]